MAVSVNVDAEFKKFNPYGYNNTKKLNETDDPERHYFYDEVNHLVLLIGWTTHEVEKEGQKVNETFWIIQNSWNISWGPKHDGCMEIVMGQNAYAIESQPITTYWREKGSVVYPPEPTKENMTTGELVAIICLSIIAVALLGVLIVITYLYMKQKNSNAYKVIEDKEEK